MCLLLFGIFAICGIVCFSNAYLCLPTKDFFATVFSQIMHISRDSCKIALWHFSQITLSWCNILFSCIWLASKLFPYAVMSKSILLVDVPLQYRHIFCLVFCNLHLASTGIFFSQQWFITLFTDKFLSCGNNKAVWECMKYYTIVRIVSRCLEYDALRPWWIRVVATCTYAMICVCWNLCEIRWCYVEFRW